MAMAIDFSKTVDLLSKAFDEAEAAASPRVPWLKVLLPKELADAWDAAGLVDLPTARPSRAMREFWEPGARERFEANPDGLQLRQLPPRIFSFKRGPPGPCDICGEVTPCMRAGGDHRHMACAFEMVGMRPREPNRHDRKRAERLSAASEAMTPEHRDYWQRVVHPHS